MPLYALTIFLSAFLLFQVQPVIARILLPWFGGTAAVWTVCLLFFQVVLLLGYGYAHFTEKLLSPLARKWVHVGLLIVSLATLPIMPRTAWKPHGSEDPTASLLWLLLGTVGLPYFLCSTTGPLLQAWYAARARSEGGATVQPYRLYALSNLGSMLGLLTYPFCFEPMLELRQQAYLWSGGYAVFVVLCAVIAIREKNVPQQEVAVAEDEAPAPPAPTLLRQAAWFSLAACSCTLLLSVTTHLTQNVAAIPFLWVLPLSLYLLSFIVCFGGRLWVWHPAFLPVPVLAVAIMIRTLGSEYDNWSIYKLIPLHLVGLFICCVLCHGELNRIKPHARYLTLFYLLISAGGACGGLFVGLIAPQFFADYYELPLALIACGVVALGVVYSGLINPPKRSFWGHCLPFILLALAIPVHLFIDQREIEISLMVSGGLSMGALLLATFLPQHRWKGGVLVVPAAAMLLYAMHGARKSPHHYDLTVRNFYGVLHVSDFGDKEWAMRTLTHGTIVHGRQFLAPDKRLLINSYYAVESGVGRAVRLAQARGRCRIGVIGLGTGSMAAYGLSGDVVRFYEINPLVFQLAGHEFTYLRDTPAGVQLVAGDARLALEREPPQELDVLVVDAFSSDSIPVHLLTLEAFKLYQRHLRPGGVLAVHISNRFLDLQPVADHAAAEFGLTARVLTNAADDNRCVYASQWVLMARDPGYFNAPLLKDVAVPLQSKAGVRTWTDAYSNLLQILKPPSGVRE